MAKTSLGVARAMISSGFTAANVSRYWLTKSRCITSCGETLFCCAKPCMDSFIPLANAIRAFAVPTPERYMASAFASACFIVLIFSVVGNNSSSGEYTIRICHTARLALFAITQTYQLQLGAELLPLTVWMLQSHSLTPLLFHPG